MDDFAEVEFRHPENARLERPTSFGSEVEDRGLVARIGMRPLPFPLETVKDLDEASELGKALRNERFKTWIVPHRFSVIRRSGLREPTSASLQVQYCLEEGQTCSVQALLPQPQYVQAGTFRFSCALDASGSVVPIAASAPSAALVDGNLSVQIRGGVAAAIAFSGTVNVPVVSAVGVSSDLCEWVFGERGNTLLGKDTSCWSLVVLPRTLDRLSLKLRLRLTHRIAFFASRMDTDWVELGADLPEE